jgi:hypothetical protein
MILDLQNNKYDMNTLKNNIYALSLREILETQEIDEYFIVNYILNKDYQLTKEDEITIDMVLKIKKNINKKLLIQLFIEGTFLKTDGIDFEAYANDKSN